MLESYSKMVIYDLVSYLRDQYNALTDPPDGDKDPRVDDYKMLLDKLILLRKYADESYYSRIEKLYPWYTNHGKRHIDQVHLLVAQLLHPIRTTIHPFALFILAMAIYYHDTGMITSRVRHGEEVRNVLAKLSEYMPNRGFESAIKNIASVHTGSIDKLERLSTQEPLSITESKSIDARALASLLRFADEVSETCGRIDEQLLLSGKVPEESRVFWEYAYCIKSAVPKVNERRIEIIIKVLNSTCFKEFVIPNKDGSTRKAQFFDYLLERLDKMDKERRNCCANFRHLVSIDSIDIDIHFVDEDSLDIQSVKPIQISLNEKFCERNSFIDAFYKHHPHFSHDNRAMVMKEFEQGGGADEPI